MTDARRDDAALQRWIMQFRPRALAAGIAQGTLERAFEGARFDPAVIAKDRNQGEFARAIWDYLDTAASAARIGDGIAALAANRALLARIEAAYGVEAEIVVAIWGLESAYGTRRGDHPLIGTLATLAHDARRGAFFERELIAALTILQSGDAGAAALTGSWAGAMGHTQFMPTSYLAHAVDFSGDGRRDIWSDDPTDALASTAAYLADAGWRRGKLWGLEVTLPPGFDHGAAAGPVPREARDWHAIGVRTVEGSDLPDHGPASVLLPAGARGPAFLIFTNFGVLARYNAAEAYVIGVGHLADRLRGGAPIRTPWPREDRVLNRDERVEVQERLTLAGFDTGGADGRIGPATRAALRAFQVARGLVPDGHASRDMLTKLRSGPEPNR